MLTRMSDGEMVRILSGVVGQLGLGLATGFSPTLIAVTLRILTGTPRPDRAIAFMLAGLVAGSTALLLLLQVVDPRSIEQLVTEDAHRILVFRGVDLTAGALFLVAGAVMAIRSRRPRKPRRAHPAPAGRPWEMILLGASSVLLSMSSIATLYMAARIIGGIHENDVIRGASYLVFVVGLIAVYAALALLWRRVPAFASRAESLFRRLGALDLRPWEAGIVLLAGAVFLALGIWGAPRV